VPYFGIAASESIAGGVDFILFVHFRGVDATEVIIFEDVLGLAEEEAALRGCGTKLQVITRPPFKVRVSLGKNW